MVSHQERRKKIIRSIFNACLEAENLGGKIIKEKLIGELGVKQGVARRTALEYIQTLITANVIKEEWDKSGVYLVPVKENKTPILY